MQRVEFALVALWALVNSGVVFGVEVRFPAAPPANITITAQLHEPTDTGVHPAVILLHTGGGVGGDRQWSDYQDRLRAARFTSLVVDSYGPRARSNMLQWDPELARQRICDAIGAIQYLQTLPTVDRNRIAVIGASDGGRVALELAAGFAPNAPSPRAIVAYYPSCPRRPVSTLCSPVMVHEAELDDWPVQCSAVFTRLTDAGAPLQVYRYRARHGFDNPALAVLIQTPGGSLEYNADVERIAWSRTLDFLRQHLSH